MADAAPRRGGSGCVRPGAAWAGAVATGATAAAGVAGAAGGVGAGGALARPAPRPRRSSRRIAPRKIRLQTVRTGTRRNLVLILYVFGR